MTKIERAIEDLKNVSNMSGYEMLQNDNDILIRKTAENAVELLKERKQYKVKNIKNVSDWIIGGCPSCGSSLHKEFSPNFCGHCGDAIDWRESEQDG